MGILLVTETQRPWLLVLLNRLPALTFAAAEKAADKKVAQSPYTQQLLAPAVAWGCHSCHNMGSLEDASSKLRARASAIQPALVMLLPTATKTKPFFLIQNVKDWAHVFF